jgi:DNA (cytosine-5)-methyltransferase 1
MQPITVSLFCGAGGEAIGKEMAFRELGLETRNMKCYALNHWSAAVAAIKRNLPHVSVHQEDIRAVTAATFDIDKIALLWGSPSCTHFARARGGLPKEDQERSHAWEVMDRWIRVANVENIIIENVNEFQTWGPIYQDHSDGCIGLELANGGKCRKGCHYHKPIPERAGEYFKAFVQDLRDLGYEVEHRLLCAADYGDATSRMRFFLQASRDRRGIHWPEPTHRNPRKTVGLFDTVDLPPWRTAAEIIDWSIPCPSIFNRKKPLAEATLRRIAAGVMRYVVHNKPFVVPGLSGRQAEEFVAPSIVHLRGTSKAHIQASSRSVEEPLRTLSAGGRHAALVAAFLAKNFTGVVGQDLERPLGTVTTKDHHSLVAATLITNTTGHAPTDLSQPLPTVTTGNQQALVAAFLQSYYGEGGSQSQSLDSPLHTVTTKARHSLVTVEIDGTSYAVVDIGLRMLEPHELARATGFPDTYEWLGEDGKPLSKADRIKMIGNAVPTGLSKALVKAVVQHRPDAFGLVEDVA